MKWETYLAENQSGFVNELIEFLRIPSVSALSEHDGDVSRASEWVASRLRSAGLEGVEILPTGGHPVVTGHHLHAPGKPTILIYGHFDTQPVDPIDLWTDPPFEPKVKDGRIYARGASDDKGNMFIPILAIESLLRSEGSLPVNVKFFLEGQEEIGSPQIGEFLSKERSRFSCDLVLSADGCQWSEDRPCLFLGLKGLTEVQIDVQGPNRDLHSGGFGGAIQNPIHSLAHLLSTLHGEDGRVTVDGFYDRVKPVSEEERERIRALPYQEDEFLSETGVKEVFGEVGYSTHERLMVRPTLEVNGIWGGFQGDGTKTVLPAKAHAKISCRLVADQDPDEIAELLARHVERHQLPGAVATLRRMVGTATPYVMPFEHPGNQAASEVLTELYGHPPYAIKVGGTIPVTSLFLSELNAYTVCFAFGLMDENHHSPDEFFRLSSFARGQTAYCKVLKRLARCSTEELQVQTHGV